MARKWINYRSNSLIAIGVWGELWFAKRAREADDAMVAEANARAAEANQKAVEAGLETEKLRGQFAWRLLPLDVMAKLAAKLRTKPGSVVIECPGSDPDSQYFAMQFERAFTMGHWSVSRRSGAYADVWFGLIVPIPAGESAETSTFIMEAFRSAGLGFNIVPTLPTWASAVSPGGSPPPTEQTARIYIGPKQPVM
jgi:hypothetical protein